MEVRDELRTFVQEEIAEGSGSAGNKRKAPKTSEAQSSRHDDGTDAEMGEASFLRSSSAPPPPRRDAAEHSVLIRLPEAVGDTVAKKWMD